MKQNYCGWGRKCRRVWVYNGRNFQDNVMPEFTAIRGTVCTVE